MAVAEQAQR